MKNVKKKLLSCLCVVSFGTTVLGGQIGYKYSAYAAEENNEVYDKKMTMECM